MFATWWTPNLVILLGGSKIYCAVTKKEKVRKLPCALDEKPKSKDTLLRYSLVIT